MGTANVVTMVAQPVQASYLCFEIGGILDTRRVELGDTVNELRYEKLAGYARSGNILVSDPSRIRSDSSGILAYADKFLLATLRNEDRKASLDSAVNTRQNIYYSKYANSAAVISTIRGYYSQSAATSKARRLETLSDIAQQQAMDLQQAYSEDDRLGVVRATTSNMETTTRSSGEGKRASKFFQESVGRRVAKGTTLPRKPPSPWEGYPQPWRGYPSMNFVAPTIGDTAVTTGVNYEESNHGSTASAVQSATHVDYEYRTPYHEARARNNRAQISLIDQKFEQYMFQQNLPHLEQIFQNELASVDNDVYQLQVALLRSLLICPFTGIVTGVYKHPGDVVNAGEPVMRVEDNSVVHLVAELVHHGRVHVGATATITTTLAGAANPATTFNGTVVAARGQGGGGRWEVIVKVNNTDGTGNVILPLSYYFDAEFTQMTIV